MNLFDVFRDQINLILSKLSAEENWPSHVDLSSFTVELPREAKHGDLTTNAAMILAKPLGQPPHRIAARIAEQLLLLPNIIKAEIAGPGFINVTLSASQWQQQLQYILQTDERYGDCNIGLGKIINVEIVSANPTGPLHTGHSRNAVLGDAIAALLQKVGYQVCREYYINDAGGQIDALARSVHVRYREALGHSISPEDFKDGMYGGDYLVPVGKKLAQEFGDKYLTAPESSWISLFKKTTIDAMMNDIRNDLASLGVHIDTFVSEAELVAAGGVEKVLEILDKKGDLYTGILVPPKGHTDEDWEQREQTLFQSTKYGDDVDRAVKKSDGSWTYFAGDIAYHMDKFRRGFTDMINVFGADHGGYTKRITAAVSAITGGAGKLEIITTQLVNFLENGVPVKMSKRAGVFITLREVVERVGKDSARFMMLSRRQDMQIDFDFAKVLEQSRDNPVFYIQYAHARICSVLRHGRTIFPETSDLSSANLALLNDPCEIEMIKILSNWPRQVEVSAVNREPHRITNYLYDVASAFHALWNKGKDNSQLRFIEPDNMEITMARQALIKGVLIVLANGLHLFGITPVQEMR